MSSPTPVHIPELPIATALNDPDVFVINQGGIDRQLAASFIKGIKWADILPTATLNPSDLVLIYQGGISAKVPASKFFMQSTTRSWFYQSYAPTGWTLLMYAGDALLAVKGGSTFTVAGSGTPLGTWQQTATTLTINQMPAHTHQVLQATQTASGGSGSFRSGNTNFPPSSAHFTASTGGGLPHDHGNIWRPMAYVGVICQKN